MAVAEHEPMSADRFLVWIEAQEERYELADGLVVRMMAGAKESHNVVTTNIVVSLAAHAKRRGCRTTSSDTAVRTGPRGIRFPDVVVDCGPPDADAKEASRPTIVVEVSSPGTLATDLADKLEEYRGREDIRVIVLVEPDVVSVRVYRRDPNGVWSIEKYDDLADTVHLPEIGGSLALADVYDTLEPRRRPQLHVVVHTADDRTP
ncbi:Uma2 family endonuclease [Jiella sonneratiae]|uniref:Uma2 family endonuclease n=1 Tax=Jiella sonneratiae TaxID=2816856 RepID=A0ABS3J433_9HYPH|nr:Uma2 family endonuclease [Jiella sonneratiae]MBO0904445.1 Uma2 family endonuclease [Jiella sonneratiae]